MSAKVFDDSMSIGRTTGRIRRETVQFNRGPVVYRTGTVLTWHGIVSVYSDEDSTRYDFVWRGRLHMRSERRARTARGLAIQAAKFAHEIASSPSTGDTP